MGVIGNYYLNGPSLASATNIYTDAALTTAAPDGFYSEGGLFRESIGGVLGQLNTCQSCISSCPLTINNAPAPPGLYTIQVDLGLGTGAVVVEFSPGITPSGILANFAGSPYNAVSSPVDGYHAATNPVHATYLGYSVNGCSAGLVSGSPYAGVPDYEWQTSSFYATGLQSNVFVAPGDASFTTSGAPGTCVMVIPKLVSVSSPLIITISAPDACSASGSLVSVACPVKLTSFSAGRIGTICGEDLDRTYYNVPVTGSLGSPALYDWIFEDADGLTPLPDGIYLFDDGSAGTLHTIADGIVTFVDTPCP